MINGRAGQPVASAFQAPEQPEETGGQEQVPAQLRLREQAEQADVEDRPGADQHPAGAEDRQHRDQQGGQPQRSVVDRQHHRQAEHDQRAAADRHPEHREHRRPQVAVRVRDRPQQPVDLPSGGRHFPAADPLGSTVTARQGSNNCQMPIAPAISRIAAAIGSARGARRSVAGSGPLPDGCAIAPFGCPTPTPPLRPRHHRASTGSRRGEVFPLCCADVATAASHQCRGERR